MSESSRDAPFIVSILPHKPLNVYSTDSGHSDTSEVQSRQRQEQYSQRKDEHKEKVQLQQHPPLQQEGRKQKVSVVDSPHWESASRGKRPLPKWTYPRNYPQNICTPLIPVPRVCNVRFPFSERLDDRMKTPLLNGTLLSSTKSLPGTGSGKDGRFSSAGGVVSQRATPNLPPTAPPAATVSERDVFKQAGGYIPRPEARVVHPQGFRILKNRSVIERSLRSYFRLPPAPSAHLNEERRRAQRQLLAVERKEDAEDARFIGATMEDPLRQPPIVLGSMRPRLLLDGFMLLCAAGLPEPEAVETVTLQCSHLVGVIKDDLTHFQNLRFLDVSENELLLEQLLPLMGLEVLHLAYNKINSLVGVARAVQEQQLQPNKENSRSGSIFLNRRGIRSSASAVGFNATHNSTSIRSAAAYYAKETSTAVITARTSTTATKTTESSSLGKEKNSCYPNEQNSQNSSMGSSRSNFMDAGVGYFSPHQRATRPTQQTSECSLHDVILPNLHALNLSFNNIPPNDVLHLSYFPFLEKLDLSGNNLCVLPHDLARLTCVSHFALERNHFRDGESIFAALSTMPALIEVNLNHNELRRVPPLSVRDGHGLCFPTIEVIGLAHNCVETAQDLAPLSELVKTLHRVVLAGNPIARRKKEQIATHALFAHAVINMYWEHTGYCSKDQTPFESGNAFHTTSLHSSGSMPSYQHRYETDEEQKQHQLRLWFPGEEDIPKSEGEEDYHGLDSLILSRGERMEPKSSVRHNTIFSQDNDPSIHNEEDSANDRDYNSEEIPHGTPTSNEANTRSLSITKDDSTAVRNLLWYDEAVPPPTHRTEPTSDYCKVKLPPTPSLLRFVELVFDDAVMQKQKVGYFYAKRRQLIAEETVEEQHLGGTNLDQLSSMVHPKTGLVTLPNYNEFMDIYQILDHSSQVHRPYGKRAYATTRGKKKKRTTNIVVSPEIEGESDEDETVNEDDTKATTENVAVETESEERESVAYEEETETSSCASVSPRDVVFMTGVGLQQEKRRGRRGRKTVESKHEEENNDKEEIPEEDKVSHGVDINLDSSPKARQHSETKAKKQQQEQQQKRKGRSNAHSSTYTNEGRRSTCAYEPPGTNVRILMNELRRMLRRPLPALPPLTTKRSTVRSKRDS